MIFDFDFDTRDGVFDTRNGPFDRLKSSLEEVGLVGDGLSELSYGDRHAKLITKII